MIVENCKYDPAKDLKPVEQLGFVDLKDSFVNSCVPSQIADTEENYNGIEDPESILGKPRDVFDGMRLVEGIKANDPGTEKDSE